MACLVSENNSGTAKKFPLDKPVMSVGRHPDCHIVIEDSSVSRFHSQLSFDGNEFFLEDLDSRNGTYLNESRLHQQVALRDGDRLRICDYSFVFRNPVGKDNLLTPSKESSAEKRDVAGVPDATMVASNMVVWDDVQAEDEGSTIMSHLDINNALDSSRGTRVEPLLKLNALMEITRALSGAITLDIVGPKVLDCLLQLFANADRGFIILREHNTFRPIAAKTRKGVSEHQMRCSRTVFEHVMQTKQAILSADTATDSRFDSAASIVDIEIRSMMCAPLLNSEGSAIGMLQLDSIRKSISFREEDLELLLIVAIQAATALEKVHLLQMELTQQQILNDLKTANEVQKAILPQKRPDVPGYIFYDFYRSANQVGGDYYDYIPLENNRWAIIVADVAGHGIASAMLMAKFSTEIRYALLGASSLSEVGEKLNQAVFGWHLDRFITTVLCVLDPATGDVQMINAGHPLVTIARHDGTTEIQDVAKNGFPVGMVRHATYESWTFHLDPGDSAVLYTDGLNEQVNAVGQPFGSTRVTREIARYAKRGVEAIGKGVIADLRIHSEKVPQADDLCLVCFGRADLNAPPDPENA